jgi:hypothetical protein
MIFKEKKLSQFTLLNQIKVSTSIQCLKDHSLKIAVSEMNQAKKIIIRSKDQQKRNKKI